MNMTLTYGISWQQETGEPVLREQDGRVVLSLVPIRSLSLLADLLFYDDDGEFKDSRAEQRYSINWSPFPDGALLFSLGLSLYQDSEDERSRVLSPAVRWQVNRSTALSLVYALSETEDKFESADLESILLALRVFFD